MLNGLGLPALCVKWNTRLGSTSPDRVAPGRPARGVSPIDVSRDLPFWMQQAEAPLPRCRAMMLSWSAGLGKKDATERAMKE